MGRIADDEGSKQVYVTEGSVYKLAHSQKSDILGVTIGNDLNALLPSELLYYADSELQDVFMLKYFTQKLQTFRYKSEIMQPSRRLERAYDRMPRHFGQHDGETGANGQFLADKTD